MLTRLCTFTNVLQLEHYKNRTEEMQEVRNTSETNTKYVADTVSKNRHAR